MIDAAPTGGGGRTHPYLIHLRSPKNQRACRGVRPCIRLQWCVRCATPNYAWRGSSSCICSLVRIFTSTRAEAFRMLKIG